MTEKTNDVYIEKIIAGGAGLGQINGRKVFVAGALPGEHARCIIREEKKSWARAELVEVLTPSPDRITAPCPVFGFCGGCMWQHMRYTAQLAAKKGITRESIRRFAAEDSGAIDVFPSDPYAYRNRFCFHRAENGRPGLMKAASNQVVPLSRCLVAVDGINAFLASPPAAIPAAINVFSPGKTYCASASRAECTIEILHGKFTFSPDSFFQSNIGMLPTLYHYMEDAFTGGMLVDLYGGAGLFAGLSADRFDEITVVEEDKRAAAYAAKNCPKARIEAVGVSTWLRKKRLNDKSRTTIILDPPRTGLDKTSRKQLPGLGAAKVIYVSCNVVTQARDLKHFLAAGYKIKKTGLFDFYPQTPHTETAVVLEKAGGGGETAGLDDGRFSS